MTKLPRITAAKLIKVVEKSGFLIVRQSGSHRIYRNAEGKRITIPYHTNKTLHPKLVAAALKDLGLTPEEFRRQLGK